MESFLVPFGKFAPFLRDPLVLVGFGLLLVFSIHRVLITNKLIPPLSQRSGTKIVRLLLHYGFLLALALIVLGSVLRYVDMREKDETRTERVEDASTAVAENTEPVTKAPVEASAGSMSPPVTQASSASQTGAVTIGEGAIVKSNAGPGGTSVGVNTGTITSTNIYNASHDERQALAHRLGVSVTTLERLLKKMEQAQIPTNRQDEKLRELTGQYKTLESQVAEVRPQHAKVEELKARARKALEEGELSRAKDILVQAKSANTAPSVPVTETVGSAETQWDITQRECEKRLDEFSEAFPPLEISVHTSSSESVRACREAPLDRYIVECSLNKNWTPTGAFASGDCRLWIEREEVIVKLPNGGTKRVEIPVRACIELYARTDSFLYSFLGVMGGAQCTLTGEWREARYDDFVNERW